MKLVLVIQFFPPKWLAGAEIATYNIAKYLAKKHDVHVITSLDEGLPRVSKELGFYVHRVSRKKPWVLGTFLFWFSAYKAICKIRPDIVHIQTIINGLPGFLAKMTLKIPYVVCGHGSDVYLPWNFKAPASRLILANADAVIALTENMKKEMEKMYQRFVYVVPNGIEVERFKKYYYVEKSKYKKTIIFIGRLQSVKGVKYLIQAMSIVRSNCNAQLIIIGNGKGKEGLKVLANNLNLNDCIQFTGQIDNEKVLEYMAQADIFVLPSLSEGFPIVILEAMASKLPIVATNVRGLPDIVEDGVNGFLVEPRNPDQLAEKIIFLLNDDKLRLKMSRANLEKAKKYDWSCVVEQLEEVYRSVCNNF